MENEKKYALLIDADNISPRYINVVMKETAALGVATFRRIYGDWTDISKESWKKVLLDHSLTPVQQYNYTYGKNASDSAMIIDAMDILYTANVDGFILVTSDSDFTRLASRLREAGKQVIGMGESKTPAPFVKACEQFRTLDVLSGRKKNSRPRKAPVGGGAEQTSLGDPESAAGHSNPADAAGALIQGDTPGGLADGAEKKGRRHRGRRAEERLQAGEKLQAEELPRAVENPRSEGKPQTGDLPWAETEFSPAGTLPVEGPPQAAEPIPTEGGPQAPEQTPAEGAPEVAEQTLTEGQPQDAGQTLIEGEPQAAEALVEGNPQVSERPWAKGAKKFSRRGQKNAPSKQAPVVESAEEHASPITSLEEIKALVRSVLEENSDDDGWMFLGDIGNMLLKSYPDFDARNYGYRKVGEMFKSMPEFEIRSDLSSNGLTRLIYLREREGL